jgi:hypothetical protein
MFLYYLRVNTFEKEAIEMGNDIDSLDLEKDVRYVRAHATRGEYVYRDGCPNGYRVSIMAEGEIQMSKTKQQPTRVVREINFEGFPLHVVEGDITEWCKKHNIRPNAINLDNIRHLHISGAP